MDKKKHLDKIYNIQRVVSEVTVEFIDGKWIGKQHVVYRRKDKYDEPWESKTIEFKRKGNSIKQVMTDLALTYNTYLQSKDYDVFDDGIRDTENKESKRLSD